MKKAFLLILLAICGSLIAGPTDGWEQACSKALKEIDALPTNAWKPLNAKLKVKRSEEPVTLTADVTGLDELWLIADDGGDSNGCDHSSWVNPVFTKADGTTESAIKAKIKSSWAQWDKVRVNKNEINQKINIAGRHAYSEYPIRQSGAQLAFLSQPQMTVNFVYFLSSSRQM